MKIRNYSAALLTYLNLVAYTIRPLGLLYLVALPALAFAQIRFENVTQSAGIAYTGETFGAAWGDFNGDGWPDIWVSNHTKRPSLYVNQKNGTFRDVIDQVWSANPRADTHAAAWADFDNDGDEDLVETVGGIITVDDVCVGCSDNHLFVNEGGRLHERARELGVDQPLEVSIAPLWLDADCDGRLDLLVINWLIPGTAPSTLYKQTEKGFRPSNQAFGLNDITGRSGREGLTGILKNLASFRFHRPGEINVSDVWRFAQLADLSGDGNLDLILYGLPTRVYSLKTVPFREITQDLNFPQLDKVTDVAIEDFDGDGNMDIYLAQGPYQTSDVVQTSPTEIRGTLLRAAAPPDRRQADKRRRPKAVAFQTTGEVTFNFVYPYWRSELSVAKIFLGPHGQNPEHLSFTLSPDTPELAGPLSSKAASQEGIGIEYDKASNTWTVSNYATTQVDVIINAKSPIENLHFIGFKPFKEQGVDALLIRDGNRFRVMPLMREAGRPTSCHSVVAGDFDNDMDIDLYLVCSRTATNLPNLLLENDGKGNFVVVPEAGGASGSTLGRGDVAITADYDRDGFLDIFLTNGSDPGSPLVDEGPHQLFRNKGNANHWLQIDLVGVQSNRNGIGATLRLETGGVLQVRGQGGGMHKFAQNHQRVHFGLGANTHVDRLTIQWPSGAVQRLENIPADQILRIQECQTGSCDRKSGAN
jgi:ASPIC and UnbV/FG-GAP-like repeat